MARPWFAFYPADYARDTPHLSLAEHGAYRLLLDLYYTTRKPLSPDRQQLLRVCRAFAADEAHAVDSVLAQFFEECERGYRHARVESELQRSAEISEKRAAFGARGAAKSNAVQQQTRQQKTQQTTSESQPQSHKPPKAPKGAGWGKDFEAFWKAYPRTPNMSKKAAERAWAKQRDNLPPLADLLATVTHYKTFISNETKRYGKPYPAKHAQGWLNEQRWEGFLAQAQTAPAATHSPDWADAVPEWGAFKAKSNPAMWNAWLKCARLNGSETSLQVDSRFTAGKIEELFGQAMEAHFGEPVRLIVREG